LASRIVVENLHAGYGRIRVLHGVSLTLNEGEVVALLGTNGNGKSTLLKCIMGMITPDSGQITLERDGERIPLLGRPTEDLVNLGIALVPEGRRLFPRCTVRENLVIGAYRAEARSSLEENLRFSYETFPILEQRKHQLAGTLSGGQQQMLAIARAMMSRPRVLLVDEPSLGLAPILVTRVIEKIKELQQRHRLTVLMAEQNFNQAIKIADRGYILVHGEISYEGKSAADLRENPFIRKYYLGV
jgi:branched-chain amino acid transport system ATP-binding protein